MLGVHVADQFWSLAGRVAQCCGSYAQFFLLKESQVILNFFIIIYGHYVNEHNVSSFSSHLGSLVWLMIFLLDVALTVLLRDRNIMLYLSTEIT